MKIFVKFISVFITLIIIFTTVSVSFATFAANETFDYVVDVNNNAVIIDCTFYNTIKITVPNEIAGKKVVGVASLNKWGENNELQGVQEIVFSEGIELFDVDLFYPTPDLKTIVFPSTFSEICEYNREEFKFEYDSEYKYNFNFDGVYLSFTNIIVSNNPYYYTFNGALYRNKDKALVNYPQALTATSYNVKPGTKEIYGYAFLGAKNLHSIFLPEGLEKIGAGAFSWSGITSITIPKSVNDCNDGLIGMDNLTTINVSSENVKYCSIDGVLFSKDKTKMLHYPNGKVGESYTVPKEVTSISSGGHRYRSAENMPSNIGYLKELVIYNSVKVLDLRSVFEVNSQLERIVFYGSMAEWEAIEKDTGTTDYAKIKLVLKEDISVPNQSKTDSENNETTKNKSEKSDIEKNRMDIYGVSFNQDTYYVKVGKTVSLIPTINIPETKRTIKWKTSDTSVISGNNIGVMNTIKGLKAGKASIILTITTPTHEYSAKCVIVVNESEKLKSLRIGTASNSGFKKGKTTTIAVTVIDSEKIFKDPTTVSNSIISGKNLLAATKEELSQISITIADSSIAKVSKIETKDGYNLFSIKCENAGETYATVVYNVTKETRYFQIMVVDGESTYAIGSIPGKSIKKRGVYNFSYYALSVYDFKEISEFNGDRKVSFNVYNCGCNYGSVDVHDKNGNIKESIQIPPYDNCNSTNIFDNIEDFAYLVKSWIDLDIYDETNPIWSAKKTVNTTVPKDGYITLTNDISASVSCSVYNMVHLVVTMLKDSISKVVDLTSEQSSAVEFALAPNVLYQLMKILGVESRSAGVKTITGIYTSLVKEITKNSRKVDSKKFIELFNQLCSGIDIDFMSFFVKTVEGITQKAIETALLKGVGSYGEIVKGLYKFNGWRNKLDFCEDLCRLNQTGSAFIYNTQYENKRVSNGIFYIDSNFSNKAIFRAYEITMLIPANSKMSKYSKVYDLALVQGNETVQPNSTAQVMIPIPDGWPNGKYKVFRLEPDGTKVDMYAKKSGNYMEFYPEHFSIYSIELEDGLIKANIILVCLTVAIIILILLMVIMKRKGKLTKKNAIIVGTIFSFVIVIISIAFAKSSFVLTNNSSNEPTDDSITDLTIQSAKENDDESEITSIIETSEYNQQNETVSKEYDNIFESGTESTVITELTNKPTELSSIEIKVLLPDQNYYDLVEVYVDDKKLSEDSFSVGEIYCTIYAEGNRNNTSVSVYTDGELYYKSLVDFQEEPPVEHDISYY